MNSKALIGINGDYRPADKDKGSLSWFNSGYYESVTAAGGLPILIPPHLSDDDLKRYLQLLDGLILAGCKQDLDPVRLGMEKHPSTRKMPAVREDFDRRLAKMAVKMRMPIVAIGSGMQTLNVVCEGTIFQHIAEDVPKSFHHRDPVESTLRHVLEIVPGTRIDQIYGPGEIRVNSDHHQSVDQPAPLFRVSARTPDGVVEAIESVDDDWFCVGVQWHPESDSASALDMQVFENLIDACKEAQPATVPFERQAA